MTSEHTKTLLKKCFKHFPYGKTALRIVVCAPNSTISCLSTMRLKTIPWKQKNCDLFFHYQKGTGRDLHGGQTRAQSTLSLFPLLPAVSFLRGINSGETLVIWNSAVTPHFAFWGMGGTRLGSQQCRVSHAHMTEIGRDTNETFRVFSDHPVIWHKNHRGNSSSLPELGIENTQAPTFNEHTLAQICWSWI